MENHRAPSSAAHLLGPLNAVRACHKSYDKLASLIDFPRKMRIVPTTFQAASPAGEYKLCAHASALFKGSSWPNTSTVSLAGVMHCPVTRDRNRDQRVRHGTGIDALSRVIQRFARHVSRFLPRKPSENPANIGEKRRSTGDVDHAATLSTCVTI